ncbi:hypothetical protein [Leucobacter sp. GX24907]
MKSLNWLLIVGLGAFALIRPVSRIVLDQLGIDLGAAFPVIATLVISAVWVLVVGLSKVAQPLLTLLFAGVVYAVLAIALSGILSPILDGQLEGPLANPIAIVPMLALNALWGAAAGGLALLLQQTRRPRARRSVQG